MHDGVDRKRPLKATSQPVKKYRAAGEMWQGLGEEEDGAIGESCPKDGLGAILVDLKGCTEGPWIRQPVTVGLVWEMNMGSQAAWQWDEMQQVGTDYADVAEVDRYEQRMGQFRDMAAEDAAILAELALPKGSHILEIGTGTGHFARAAGKAGYRATAVDVSPVMLQYAQAKAKEQGLTGVEFHQAGFLTQQFGPATFDAAVSAMALHHLPDVWKAVALGNIHCVLKPGGLLLLRDIVFSWEGQDHSACFDAFVNACPENMRKEAARHIAKEYSTLDWIMRGLLEHAGFRILKRHAADACVVQYLCGKSAH